MRKIINMLSICSTNINTNKDGMRFVAQEMFRMEKCSMISVLQSAFWPEMPELPATGDGCQSDGRSMILPN